MINRPAASDWESMDTRHQSGGVSLQPPRAAAVDERRLLQAVYRRVFGEAEPVTVGRFTLLERIASGGMGVVFKAYDNQLDRKVAVKFIQVDRAGASARRGLVKEARALARLSHPNVVQVYEVGEAADGELFLAMEFVEGVTLRAWLGSASRRWSEVVDVCLQAADGLAAAHAAGLVHGDFKPENVMVGTDPSAGVRARVVDFGLAHVGPREDPGGDVGLDFAAEVSGASTLGRGVAGTPSYMAPEQLRGAPLGPAADQFAFCVTLFEALCGARPFAGDTLGQLLENVEAQRVAVAEDRSGMPSTLHRVLLRGLAADPGARHPSMRLLADQLRALRRRPRRRGLAVAATIGTAVATMAAAAWLRTAPVPATGDAEATTLGLARAQALVQEDPSAALLALDALGDDALGPAAFVIAEQAALSGWADRAWTIGTQLSVHAVSGSKILAARADTRELLAIDALDGETTRLLQGIDPPGDERIRGDARPRLLTDPGGAAAVVFDGRESRLLDLRAGTSVSLELGSAEPDSVRFGARGTRAVIRAGEAVLVVDVPSGRRLLELAVAAGTRVHVSLEPAGTRVAVGSLGESPGVWEIDTGASLVLEPSEVAHSAFIDAEHLVTAGTRGGLTLWSLVDGTARTVGASSVRHVSLAVTEAWIVTRAADDGIHVYERSSGRLRRFEGASYPVVSSDGRWAAWLTADGRARVLELSSLTERDLAVGAPIVDLAFAEQGGGIVTWDDDRTARHWPLHAEPPAVGREAGVMTDLVLDHHGSNVVAAYREGEVCRWGASDGALAWCGEDSAPLDLALSRSGTLVASRGHGGTITVRDAGDGAIVHVTEPSQGGMVFDGDALLVQADGRLWRIDPLTGSREALFDSPKRCTNLALDPQSTRLLAACFDGGLHTTLRMWSFPDGRAADPGLLDAGWAMVMLDADHLVGGDLGHALMRIDLPTGERSTIGRGRNWTQLDRDAAGGTVAVGGALEGVALYDPAADASVVVPGTAGAAEVVAISGDGRTVAYSVDRRTISFRRREVPREPAALREWIAAHRLVEGRVE